MVSAGTADGVKGNPRVKVNKGQRTGDWAAGCHWNEGNGARDLWAPARSWRDGLGTERSYAGDTRPGQASRVDSPLPQEVRDLHKRPPEDARSQLLLDRRERTPGQDSHGTETTRPDTRGPEGTSRY